MNTSSVEAFFSQLDWLMPSLAGAELLRQTGKPSEARAEALRVIRANLRKARPDLPRLDLCGNLKEQADRLLERRLVLLNGEIQLDTPVNWSRLADTDNQRNWHLGYMYWLNALADTYEKSKDERYASQWRAYVEEFLDHCPYAADARGCWPTRPMVMNELQTCNLGENGGPRHAEAPERSRCQWMSLSCHFRIEAWLSNLARLVESPHLDDVFLVRVLHSLLNDHAYVCVMNPRENTPNQFTAVTLSLLKLSLLLPECRSSASGFLVAWERLRRVFTNNLFPDGSDIEQSPDYNCFLLDLCSELLDLLERIGAPENRRMMILEAARKRIRFLVGILSPDGTLPPIGKAHAEDRTSHLIKLSERVGDADCLEALRSQRGSLRRSIAFPYGGYYCLRESGSHLLFKASGIGSGHMHEDCLGFILWVNGSELLTDPSHYTYDNSPGEEQALNAYALGTQGHNAMTVDQGGQNRMAVRAGWPRRDSDIPYLRANEQPPLPFRACEGGGFAVVEGSYADGFGARAELSITHHRTIIRVDRLGWLVLDRLRGDTRGRTANQHWHLASAFSREEVELEEESVLVTRRRHGTNLRIMRLARSSASASILHGSMDPVGGWIFPKYGEKIPACELVLDWAIDAHPVMPVWIDVREGVSVQTSKPAFADQNSVRWVSSSGIPLELSISVEAVILRTDDNRELAWNFSPGADAPLPSIAAQQGFQHVRHA